MENFACEKCGQEVIVDDSGERVIFCEHYKPKNKKNIQSSYIPKKRNVEESKSEESKKKK